MGLQLQAGIISDKVYGAVSTCLHLEPHEWGLISSTTLNIYARLELPMRERRVAIDTGKRRDGGRGVEGAPLHC